MLITYYIKILVLNNATVGIQTILVYYEIYTLLTDFFFNYQLVSKILSNNAKQCLKRPHIF